VNIITRKYYNKSLEKSRDFHEMPMDWQMLGEAPEFENGAGSHWLPGARSEQSTSKEKQWVPNSDSNALNPSNKHLWVHTRHGDMCL
jgi:hypothetical protein